MKVITDAKKIKKAAKAAGIKVVGSASHHYGEKWVDANGKGFVFCAVKKKNAAMA